MFGFCWHKWSKWGKPFQYGFNFHQQRYCLKCNKQESALSGWFSDDDDHEPKEPNATKNNKESGPIGVPPHQGTSGKSVAPIGSVCRCCGSGGGK